MKRFFFSLRASYLFFVLLAILFGAGSRLSHVEAYKPIFREMTATHLGRCLGAIGENAGLLAWLLVFLFIGACLLINTGCCTASQIKALRRQAGPGKRPRTVQMTLIHIAALMVICLHGVDMTMIRRHQPIRVYPGQTLTMAEYKVRVLDISYVTDRSLITEDKKGGKKKIFRIPEKGFSIKDNFARLEIASPGKPPEQCDLRIMSPLRSGADFFFLDGFVIAKGSQKIAIEIHHSFNPLAFIFFAVYAILFCLLLLRYLTLRWERTRSS